MEAAKSVSDEWDFSKTNGAYDLEVYKPNGSFHMFRGNIQRKEPEARLQYDHAIRPWRWSWILKKRDKSHKMMILGHFSHGATILPPCMKELYFPRCYIMIPT